MVQVDNFINKKYVSLIALLLLITLVSEISACLIIIIEISVTFGVVPKDLQVLILFIILMIICIIISVEYIIDLLDY